MGKEIELIEMGLPVSSVHPPATSILPFIFPSTCLAISSRLSSRACCEPTNPEEGTGKGEQAEQVSIESTEASSFCFLSPWKQGSFRREGSRADVGQEPTDSDERETKKGEKERRIQRERM